MDTFKIDVLSAWSDLDADAKLTDRLPSVQPPADGAPERPEPV
jgi:hypothetical protein